MLRINAQNRSQNIAIAVTYIRQNDNSWQALFVRNSPLTRGWQSDFSRPVKRALNSEARIEGYQFSGGRIKAFEFAESTVKNIQWAEPYNPSDKALGAAALKQLKEETGLSMTDFLEEFQCGATLTKLAQLQEPGSSTVTHCWHLHLGTLNESIYNMLHYRMQITHTVAAISWLSLKAITVHHRPEQSPIYSIVPEGQGVHCFPEDRRGLQTRTFVNGQWEDRNALELLGRPVTVRNDNAEALLKLAQVTPTPYTLPDMLDLKECEILGIASQANKTNSYQVLHIPTQTYYSVQFMPQLFYQRSTQRQQQNAPSIKQTIEAFSRNQLLAAKLYELHGISVVPLKLIKAGNWLLIAQEQQPRREAVLQNLEEIHQRQLLLGLSVDIALANTAIFSNNRGLFSAGQQQSVCIGPHEALQRWDLSSSLQYQSSGTIKDSQDWQLPISIHTLQQLPSSLYTQICQLPLVDWEAAIQTLALLNDQQRVDIINQYGYGDAQTKKALADKINTRIQQTIGILTECKETLVNLPDNRTQNVTIAVTFKETQSEQPFVLLVRNNPLTRGWQSDFYRWLYQALDLNAKMDMYQFPGGKIDNKEDKLQTPWVTSYFKTQAEQRMAKAALRELWEESGLKLDTDTLSLLNLNPEQFKFTQIDFVNYVDMEKKTASTLYYLHLDLGNLTPAQKVQLFQFQRNQLTNPPQDYKDELLRPLIGRDVVAMNWVRIDTIQSAENAQYETAYSVIPRDTLVKGGEIWLTSKMKGLEKIWDSNQNQKRYRLQCRELPVAIRSDNLKRLEALGFDLRQMPYTWPEIPTIGEFEIRKEWKDDRHEWREALHVPTGLIYHLRFPLANGELEKNTAQEAREYRKNQITSKDILEQFYRNDVLTAKLYEAFGVNVLTSHLVRATNGTLGVGYIQPPLLEKYDLDSENLPDSLTDGVGCDIALANFGAVTYGTEWVGIWLRPKSNLGNLRNDQQVCIRLDYSGGLLFRGRGLFKEPQDWAKDNTINWQRVTNHPEHAGFRNLCALMDSRRWRRALTVLEKPTPLQIEEIVSTYGYGSAEERQQLANHINARVRNTALAIRRQLDLPAQALPPTLSIVNIVPEQALDFCVPRLKELIESEQTFSKLLHESLVNFEADAQKLHERDAKWLRQEIIPLLSAIEEFWKNAFSSLFSTSIDSLLIRNLSTYQSTINQVYQLFQGEDFARYFMKLISYTAKYLNFLDRALQIDFSLIGLKITSANGNPCLPIKYDNFLAAPMQRLLRYTSLLKELYTNTPDTAEFMISKNQLRNILERLLFLNKQANRIQRVTEYFATQSNLNFADLEFLMERWHQQISPMLPAIMGPQIVGLNYQPVLGNGDCLYTAVDYYLKQTTPTLRQTVGDYLKDNLEDFRGFIHLTEGRSIEDYVSAVRDGKEWATHVEIEVLMEIFQRPIIVIEAGNRITNIQDIYRFEGEPIFVYYNGRDHYNALLVKEGFNSRDILKTLLRNSVNSQLSPIQTNELPHLSSTPLSSASATSTMPEASHPLTTSREKTETPQNARNSYQLITTQLSQLNEENKQVVISSTQNANQASSSTTSNNRTSTHISEPQPDSLPEVNYPSQPAPQPKKGPRGHFTPSGYEKFKNKFNPVNPPSDSDSEEEHDDEEYMSSRAVKLK